MHRAPLQVPRAQAKECAGVLAGAGYVRARQVPWASMCACQQRIRCAWGSVSLGFSPRESPWRIGYGSRRWLLGCCAAV